MKKSFKLLVSLFILSFAFTSHLAQAQNIIQTQKVLEEEKPILFGGGLLLGGGSNSFQLGLNPELLKSYNKYIDAGIIANIYYSSFSVSLGSNEKIKNFQLGAGVFTGYGLLNNSLFKYNQNTIEPGLLPIIIAMV